jgi:uncharacterized protein YbaR (Trm112 family)
MKNRDCDLTYALDSEGKLVNIKQAESCIKCNCICPACKKPLVAKKGKEREHHFAHSSGENCEDAYETMLRPLFKIDTYEKEWFLGKGLNGLVYDEL